jgi:hypothetical protein
MCWLYKLVMYVADMLLNKEIHKSIHTLVYIEAAVASYSIYLCRNKSLGGGYAVNSHHDIQETGELKQNGEIASRKGQAFLKRSVKPESTDEVALLHDNDHDHNAHDHGPLL